MTPTGIEPVLPPWKGDVLTAWPWSHVFLTAASVRLLPALLPPDALHMIPLCQTPRVGLEPTTPRLTAVCSTIELSRKTVLLRKTVEESSILPMRVFDIPSKPNLNLWSYQHVIFPFSIRLRKSLISWEELLVILPGKTLDFLDDVLWSPRKSFYLG